MSHYIDTPQTSYGGPAGLSNRQRWEIFAGVVVAVALGIAAIAFVNSTDSPVVEQTVQSAAQSYAVADDLATRFTGPRNAESDDLATR